MSVEPALYPSWRNVLIDSHCHLIKVLPHDEDLIARLRAYPALCILDVGIRPSDWVERLTAFSQLAGVYFSIGVHPCMYGTLSVSESREGIAKHAKEAHALGEMGLDWQYLYATPERQCEFFEMQLSLAKEYEKPVIIHARSGASNAYSTDGDAVTSVLELIKVSRYSQGGIMHCFSGSYKQAMECIDRGFCISFAANVSYSSAQVLQEVARRIPLEYLLVETDAPYLMHKRTHAMQRTYFKYALRKAALSGIEGQYGNGVINSRNAGNTKKGRYNHPSYLPFSYETIARLRNMSVGNLVQALRATMQRVLGV